MSGPDSPGVLAGLAPLLVEVPAAVADGVVLAALVGWRLLRRRSSRGPSK